MCENQLRQNGQILQEVTVKIEVQVTFIQYVSTSLFVQQPVLYCSNRNSFSHNTRSRTVPGTSSTVKAPTGAHGS